MLIRVEHHHFIHCDCDLSPILEGLSDMTEASDRLAREVAETRDAFVAVTGRFQAQTVSMQAEIDRLKEALANGDTAAATAAADALDALQTEMAATGVTPPTGGDTTTGPDTTGDVA